MAVSEAMTMPDADQRTGATSAWRAMLVRAGALFDGDRVTAFGDAEAERGCALSGDVVADLSHFGLIAVQGPDAPAFLASLFPGDVRLISASQAQFTGWCDGKGRLLATFWLFMRGEVYYLLLPMALLGSTMARLCQFRLRSKVAIADASGELARLGLSGPGLAASLAPTVAEPLPLARGETVGFGDCTLVSIGAPPFPRWIAIGPVDSLQAFWESLGTTAKPVGADVWSLLDVLAGIPLLVSETSGEFVPQMVNLEALGGLCFTKGCYPGQEVVARLHYRGQLKRRLYRAFVDSEELPQPGAKLFAPNTSESVGMVVSAAFAPQRKIAVLAVVVIEHQERGEIFLTGLQGPRLQFQSDEDRSAVGE